MSFNITKYKEGSVEQREFLQKVEALNKRLNNQPEGEFIRQNDGNDYVVISHIETSLDELFFGQWDTKKFKYQQICNELIADLELTVTHPITGEKVTRVGCAGVAIMQNKGSKIIDFATTKKKNALVTNFPALKAECIKNAAKSIGKYFGRDLNRKVQDNYTPLIPIEVDTDKLQDGVMQALDTFKGDSKEKEEIRLMCLEKAAANEFNETFANQIMERIHENS